MKYKIKWPHNKKFAFSIFDDTDNATVSNIAPLYDFLKALDIRITKSVWPLKCDTNDYTSGQSLEDSEYLDFILKLKDNGFEIGYHGARAGDNRREVTIRALDYFKEKIGHDPLTYAQHARSVENIYWGGKRTILPFLKPLVSKFSERSSFFGDDPQSPYFWGDLCKTRIKYCRNYGFSNTNLLRSDPWTPYYDARKPLVNLWFSSSGIIEISNIDKQISAEQIKKWEKDGALVIMFTHFAHNFYNGELNRNFKSAFERLASTDGWFMPVGTILDYILDKRGAHYLTSFQSLQLELRWAMNMGRKLIK